MDIYPEGFEEDHVLRSNFIRDTTLQQIKYSETSSGKKKMEPKFIPKTLVRYWHEPNRVPDDVQACINSWDRLSDEGFELRMFGDSSGTAYIADKYGAKEVEAFSLCRHPAMRSDYFRMCFILAEGGFYVDTDDVLVSDEWRHIFQDDRLKVQPLCYDIVSSGMLPATDIWQTNLNTNDRIFYVNNNPIAAPANHPVLRRALYRATEKLLGNDCCPEIQETTGPGNFTAALAAHARELMIVNATSDFELLSNWDSIAETRWELSYRNDTRNWRNMDVN